MMLACTRDIGCSATPSCFWAELVLSRLGKWGTLDRSFSVSDSTRNNDQSDYSVVEEYNVVLLSANAVVKKQNMEVIVIFVSKH